MKNFLRKINKSKKLWAGPLIFVIIILLITILIDPEGSSIRFNYKLF